ncbi:MAG: dockerin type I repeat-containing protein [Ruminococcus sp.]|nr:dockerin type I repeat-containing protein [Ruminococcus sp.]
MKKTEKTALTAAAFAAVLNVVPMGAAAYDPSEEPIQDVYGPPVYFETTTPEQMTPQPDYGPMPAYTTETTAVPVETTVTVTEVIPQPVYGPPIIQGDLNFDGVVDSFDLINMRKLFSNGEYSEHYDEASDINRDGRVTVADLVLMNRYLLGKDKVMGESNTTEPEITTTTETEFYAVYGPPAWFDQQTTVAPDDPIADTETSFTTVYGPPAMMRNTETTAVPEE